MKPGGGRRGSVAETGRTAEAGPAGGAAEGGEISSGQRRRSWLCRCGLCSAEVPDRAWAMGKCLFLGF